MIATRKLVLTALTAACALALSASVASALRALRLSERVIQLQTAALVIEGGGFRVSCEARLTLTLHETRILKRPEVIGEVEGEVLGQEAGREACGMEGRARILPFVQSLHYLAFTGTLPEITGIKLGIEQLRILVTAAGGLAHCLIEAAAEGTQAVARGLLRELRGFTLIETMVISLGGICPRAAEVRVSGTFALNSPRSVRVELV